MPKQHSDQILDATGLSCPLPILRAKKALLPLQPGQVLLIRATDPASMADFRAFCLQTGNILKAAYENQDEYWIYVEKKNA